MKPVARSIAVMAKIPEPGAVKTRLVPPLDLHQAALLYRAFLRDTILTAQSVANASVNVVYPPTADVAPLHDLVPARVALVPQTAEGLGSAMCGAFRDLWSTGSSTVVLIGSDLPTLPACYISDAFKELEGDRCDLVLGPADDGGYYLIGLREDQPELFKDVEWSTSHVLKQTLDRAHALGLRVKQLPGIYDVDDPGSFHRLIVDLERNSQIHASATRDALRLFRRTGVELPDHSTALE